jgi:hypothetical protein
VTLWPLLLVLVVAAAWTFWRIRRRRAPSLPVEVPWVGTRREVVRAVPPVEVDAVEIDEIDTVPDEGEPLWIPLASTDVPDGCFIVAFEGSSVDEYITLWTHRTDADRKISYLRGRDNTAEYVVVGRVFDDGVRVAPAFAENDALERGVRQLFSGQHVEAHERFLRDSADYAARTGGCGRCGRPISSSLSVWRGLGPECFAKAGKWHLC